VWTDGAGGSGLWTGAATTWSLHFISIFFIIINYYFFIIILISVEQNLPHKGLSEAGWCLK
jgi:hypothetical protein